jgi:hypothetical protein
MPVDEWLRSYRFSRWPSFWKTIGVQIAAWSFRSQRADYYEYLADLIDTTGGSKTLLNVFQDDALRYTSMSARGVLSRTWLERFPQAGGDLFATWSATLPLEDLLAIQSAQYAGAHALTRTLRQLANVVRLIDHARSLLVSTAFVGVAGLLMAFGSILSIPIFTAKQFRQVFSAVPHEFFSSWTKALFATEEGLIVAWPFLGLLLLVGMVGLFWSFANWTGKFRGFADRIGPWAFYRRVQTLRFISLLAVTLSPGGCHGARLRDAISLQAQGASPWFAGHLSAMITRLDLGAQTTDALNTGLIDPEIWWYFTDLTRTLGLDEALHRTRLRTELHAVKRIGTQALYLRWGALLFALSVVLGIAFWHAQVFDELRQALSLHYSR